MKVLHICSSISRNIGGPARSVQGLVAALNAHGVDTWLMAMKPYDEPWVDGVADKYLCANRFVWFGMKKAVETAIERLKPDIVHVHSIWQWTLHLAVAAARSSNVPYVISPRGTLGAWALKQKSWKKRLALATYQGVDLRKAAGVHCTSDEEVCQVKKLFPDMKIIFSPNGVNVPAHIENKGAKTKDYGQRRALFLSRFHYTKGILNLIEAWAAVRPEGWVLELVGTDEADYLKVVKRRMQELKISESIEVTGPLMDDEKWKAYARADLFVLPTFTENFGIVIAEALYAGVPVITTRGAPWEDIATSNCGWWIDVGVDPLVVALKEATNMSVTTLMEMGRRGHRLINDKYTWSSAAQKISVGYQEILTSLQVN